MKRFIQSAVLPVGLLLIGATAVEAATVWALGARGRNATADDGGVKFVQEGNDIDNPPDPNSPATDQQADDDYFFAGEYPAPISTVANDEIAMERAFAGADNSLRIHFNLPTTFGNGDNMTFSYTPYSLDQRAAEAPNPRYGLTISFNGVEIQAERLIVPGDIFPLADTVTITTDPFNLGDVNALYGPGGDNVIELSGTNYNADGGGNWAGFNHHQLDTAAAIPEPSSSLLIFLAALAIPFYRRRR